MLTPQRYPMLVEKSGRCFYGPAHGGVVRRHDHIRPGQHAAISSARIVGVWVRLFIAESPRFYRSESNAGLPFWITHTAGLDWKFPLHGALVRVPAVPSYV